MTSPDCDKILDRVYEFLNRHDVTARDEADIRRHLKDCPPCDDKFEFERKLLERLREAGCCPCPESLKTRVKSLLDIL